jgi:branched-chain amino acid transport system substrate-binding protein
MFAMRTNIEAVTGEQGHDDRSSVCCVSLLGNSQTKGRTMTTHDVQPAGDELDPFLQRVLTRRQMMLGAFGSAAAAAILAACGGSDAAETVDTKAAAPAGSAAPPASEAPAGSAAPAGSEAPAVSAATPTAGGGTNAAKFGGGGGDGTLKIGFTAPLTGALAGFGEANEFILAGVTELVKDGLMIGDKSYTVEVIVKDTESSSDTAASRAGELIIDEEVDMMLAIATPEMINPVADQCEANGVPCLSTLAPWQPYFFGRGGDPAVGFDWTYHFFWGAEQLIGNFVNLWDSIDSNKKVGLFAPNDPDGNALSDAKTGFPAGAAAGGYTMVDPGRYETGSNSFDSIISKFIDEEVDIVVGIPIPPDFANFWTAAKQKGFNPKMVTVAKALLFPAAVEALADIGNGICTEIWWTPDHPFSSSLTGIKAKELSAAYEEGTGKQWTQFVGFVHALFEVALDVVSRAGSTDKQAISDAAAATSLDTIVGPVAYGAGGVPRNISPTSLVGGQWQKSDGAHPFELLVTNNPLSPEIPVTGKLIPLG